jgi:hypothetical protein
VNDRNYDDIDRRSAYADYESSVAEARALEELIRLVKNFDDTIKSSVEKSGGELLPPRDVTRFEFRDVNHLSHRGAYDVTQEYLRPHLTRHP